MNNGHDVKIAAIKKDVTYELLNAYNFQYERLGENKPGGILKKIPLIIESDIRLSEIASRFKPDVFVSSYSPISALISRLHGKKHLAFHDTENTSLTDFMTAPFTDVICTPKCFLKDYGEKQVRYNGYKELCYLHPRYFQPDDKVLDRIGARADEPLIFLRLASFSAHHDLNQKGITNPLDLIRRLEKHGRVILSSEINNPDLEKYVVRFKPEDAHSLLFYSRIFVGDSATMATEAGILGTPSLYVSTFKGTLGNFIELEEKYRLVYSFKNIEEARGKIDEILSDTDSKKVWDERRTSMLNDKIDVNEFLYNQILSTAHE
jgi:hypothetical protein